tara:strand:+ start:168 stop:842 length:675 start_codon:yes stop_codon:yes gene_type:complete
VRYLVTLVLAAWSLSISAQETGRQTEGEVPLDGAPVELPDNSQEGDLNTNTQVGGDNTSGSYNSNKTYNGAGSSGMPVSTAISPSLMSNGNESCLQSITGGLQLIGVGVSSGKYTQDNECNRRRDAITLSNMGMKVAAVSLMCQNPSVWRAMFMSATPCPITRGGKLIVGKNALLEIKRNPELHIADYSDNKELYDNLLGVGTDDTTEVESTISVSDRFRTSVQ